MADKNEPSCGKPGQQFWRISESEKAEIIRFMEKQRNPQPWHLLEREASGISDPRGMRNWWFIWVAESGSPFLTGSYQGLESWGRTPGTLTASRERCEGGITTTQALWDNHCSRLRWRKPADKRDSQVHRWADWHHERQAWDSANGNESWRNRANGMWF